MNPLLYSGHYFLQATVFAGALYYHFQAHPLALLRKLPHVDHKVQLLSGRVLPAQIQERIKQLDQQKEEVFAFIAECLDLADLKKLPSFLEQKKMEQILASCFKTYQLAVKRILNRIEQTLPGWKLFFGLSLLLTAAYIAPSKKEWIEPLIQASYKGCQYAHMLHIALTADTLLSYSCSHNSALQKLYTNAKKALFHGAENTFRRVELFQEDSICTLNPEDRITRDELLAKENIIELCKRTALIALCALGYKVFPLSALIKASLGCSPVPGSGSFTSYCFLPLVLWTQLWGRLVCEEGQLITILSKKPIEDIGQAYEKLEQAFQYAAVFFILLIKPYLLGYELFRSLGSNLLLFLLL